MKIKKITIHMLVWIAIVVLWEGLRETLDAYPEYFQVVNEQGVAHVNALGYIVLFVIGIVVYCAISFAMVEQTKRKIFSPLVIAISLCVSTFVVFLLSWKMGESIFTPVFNKIPYGDMTLCIGCLLFSVIVFLTVICYEAYNLVKWWRKRRQLPQPPDTNSQ